MTGSDDELLARLRAADPAAGLPPVGPARVDRLVEDVMSTELTTENRETGTHQRSPLTWLVAAAAVLVIAGAGFVGLRALTGDDDGGPPVAGQVTPTVTHLTVAGAGTARCMAPTVEAIGTAEVAFDGTVTQVAGEQVTMEPTHWYAGDPTDEVVVAAPSEQLQRLASAVTLQQGDRYLISAVDGKVALCGLSAAYDEDLAALYQRAFG